MARRYYHFREYAGTTYGERIGKLPNGTEYWYTDNGSTWVKMYKRAGDDTKLATMPRASIPEWLRGLSLPSGAPVVGTMTSGGQIRTPESEAAYVLATTSAYRWGGLSNGNYSRVLNKGMAGEDVKWFQRRIGAYADGLFGSGTYDKLKAWQRSVGLVSDGVYGLKSACKLQHPGANCGAAPAKPSTGTGGNTGGSKPTPTPTPTPKPKPKPAPPYKLPIYKPASSDVTNLIPISDADLWWANWEVFNAYELARVQHNEYFETLQPNYNVIPNISTILHNTDESDFLTDSERELPFATPDSTQDLAVLAFGSSVPTTNSTASNVYAVINNDLETNTKRARLMGVKFLRSTTELKVGTGGPYIMSYIKQRLDSSSAYQSVPITLSVTVSQTNFSLSWSSNPYASGYEVYEVSLIDGSPIFITSVAAGVRTWQSPTYPASTQKQFQVKAFRNVGDLNTPAAKVYIAISNAVTAKLPAATIGPTALAPMTKIRPVNGRVIVRFGLPTPTTYFGYVKFTVKEGSYPTSINDGKVMGPYNSSQANVDIALHDIGTDPANRTKDRQMFVKCWSFNTAGTQASGSTQAYTVFLRNPIDVSANSVDSWGSTGGWEASYGRMRASNYGSSNKYRGLWFYGTKLQTVLGGRAISSLWVHVQRKDGGSAGAIPIFLGDHNYTTHPTTTTAPAITNVAQSAETIARNTNQWFRIDRFGAKLTAGTLTGLGMYRQPAEVNDVNTFVGQSDANGNAYSTDGLVRIYHIDFSS